MHATSIIASAGLLATAAFAAPQGGWWGRGRPSGWNNHDNDWYGGGHCLTNASAWEVANNFGSLISAYSAANAEAFLTTDFVDYSSSVNELIDGGCPSGPVSLTGATFTSLAAFLAGQGSQPNIDFNILNVWHGCNHVTLRWRSYKPNPVGGPATQEPVTGVVLLETVYNDGHAAVPFQISATYSEFNSGAWLYDLGIFVPNCSASKKRDVGAALTGAHVL